MTRPVGIGLVVVLLGTIGSGCTTSDSGEPAVVVSPTADAFPWGGAAQLAIENVGDAQLAPPVRVQVISDNGTVVRTYDDVTNGRGLSPGGKVVLAWDGRLDSGGMSFWGTYRVRVAGSTSDPFELTRPPLFAITVDAIPRDTPAGSPIEFRVNNTGTTWVNGTMDVAAGRDETVLYTASARVEMAPGTSRSFFWNGRTPDGATPEATKYLIAVRVEPDDGPTPFAQDVFTLT